MMPVSNVDQKKFNHSHQIVAVARHEPNKDIFNGNRGSLRFALYHYMILNRNRYLNAHYLTYGNGALLPVAPILDSVDILHLEIGMFILRIRKLNIS